MRYEIITDEIEKLMEKTMLRFKRLTLIMVSLVVLSTGIAWAQQNDRLSVPGPVTRNSQARLASEIARLSSLSGGIVGVSAIHIESGKHVSVNGQERFPMASTYKIPIAVQVLTLVDQGSLKWGQMVEIRQTDLRPGSGVFSKLLHKPGLAVSVRNLFEIMMTVSDNTAADVLLSISGGPGAVTARMKTIGISDIDISRSTLEMIADSSGVRKLPPDITPMQFDQLEKEADPRVKKKMRRQFDADLRDTATPDAMVSLLRGIYRKTCLKPDSANILLDAMQRSQMGEMRLKGMLPPGTPVAHKSGTLGGSTNDVGIITLPEDAGHVVVTIFIKTSKKETSDREKAIAEIARAVYDFYLFGDM
jgi:beta-lactamase class A